MQHSVKNNLVIGFIVSVLLSLFVNFSMLMLTYKMQFVGFAFSWQAFVRGRVPLLFPVLVLHVCLSVVYAELADI